VSSNKDTQIENPSHYSLAEPMNCEQEIDVIFAKGWGPGFCLGNVDKYIERAGKKSGEETVKDLKKARQYLTYLINSIETNHPRGAQ